MLKLIKNGKPVTDPWKTLTLKDRETPESVRLPVGPVLVPLSVWKSRKAELIHREYEHGWPIGIWLNQEDQPEHIAEDIEDFSVIAIEFDRHSDGNGFRIARALREQYGYSGELRATGDIPADKPVFQRQAVFDSYTTGHNRKFGNFLSEWPSFDDALQQRPVATSA